MEEVGKKIEALGTVREVRIALMQLGWGGLTPWCLAHGYSRSAAQNALRAWGLRTDKTPHGGIARAVMRDLRATLTEGRSPGQNVPDHLVEVALATSTPSRASTEQGGQHG